MKMERPLIEQHSLNKNLLTNPKTRNMFYQTQNNKMFGNVNETALDSVDLNS